MSTININNYEAWFLDYAEGNLTNNQVAELLLFVENHPELKQEFESFEIISLNDESSLSLSEKNSLKKSELNFTKANAEEWIIRYIENDLSEEEKNEIERIAASDKTIAREIRLYRLTRLQHNNEQSDVNAFNKQLTFTELVLPENKELLALHICENLLGKEELGVAMSLVDADPQLQQLLNAYQKTISTTEEIIFADKSSLKKERKIIPFNSFVKYSSYAAAACLLVFFLYSGDKTKTNELALDNSSTTKTNTNKDKNNKLITTEESDKNKEEEYVPGNPINKTYANHAFFSTKEDKRIKIDFDDKKHSIVEDDQFAIIDDSLNANDREDIIIPYTPSKENIALVDDSLQNDDVALASNNADETPYLSPKQLIIKKVNSKLFGTDKTTFGKEELQKTAELGLNSITGKETTIASSDSDEASRFTISLGGFEFSRKKTK